MDSSLIGKVEKSKRYSCQKDRVQFSNFTLRFQGDHRRHELNFREGFWNCSCSYFPVRETCSHVMAMERILDGMLPSTPASVSPS